MAEGYTLHRTFLGIIETGEKVVIIVSSDKISGALGITLADLFLEMEQNQ